MIYKKPIIVNEIAYQIRNTDTVILNLEEVRGKIIPSDAVIELERGLEQQVYNQTLLHEIVHAIQLAYNIQIDDLDMNERYADCLASGFLSLIKHNKELILFLLGMKK